LLLIITLSRQTEHRRRTLYNTKETAGWFNGKAKKVSAVCVIPFWCHQQHDTIICMYHVTCVVFKVWYNVMVLW